MTTALAPRRMLLCFLIVLAALLFAGAGHAAAAQRSTAPQWTMTVQHAPVAYSDGPLRVARHLQRKRPVAHACAPHGVVAASLVHKTPVACADGLLTVARHRQHHRQISAHTA